MTTGQWTNFINQFDNTELHSKLKFNDFLTMMMRESFFRDTLAEAQIYKHSSRRLVWKDETKLITQAHLAALQKAESMHKDIEDMDDS